jgi:hypothetical protein
MTWLSRAEIALGLLVGASAVVAALSVPVTVAVPLPDLFRWSGILILAQGLARDLCLLALRRARPQAVRRLACLCVESTLGVGLLGLCLLLSLLGGGGQVHCPLWGVLAAAAGIWSAGFLTRDLVLQIHRDPDHLAILIG